MMAQHFPTTSPGPNRHFEADDAGFVALKSAMRRFEKWLTFCCIVILLMQLMTLLVVLWSFR
jgi:hypothetical protein